MIYPLNGATNVLVDVPFYCNAITHASSYTLEANPDADPGGRVSIIELASVLPAQVSPNPFAEEISVLIETDTEEPLQLILTDVQGKVLYQSDLHWTNQINRLGRLLSNGVYLLQARCGSRTQVFKSSEKPITPGPV